MTAIEDTVTQCRECLKRVGDCKCVCLCGHPRKIHLDEEFECGVCEAAEGEHCEVFRPRPREVRE